jgi:hypothetical protein
MGYHQRVGSGRDSGRERGMRRREKARAKSKGQNRRSGGAYALEGDHVSTSEEIVDRTLKRLNNLGNQVFAVSPFSEHFGRWLVDLRVVLSEFESSPIVGVDDEFLKQRSQVLSNVELELGKRRGEEASGGDAIKSLSAGRILLGRIEKENVAMMRNTERKNDAEIKRLSSNIDGLKKEVDRIALIKTGIFRGVSKKAKTRKEVEATQRLSLAQKELASAEQNFASEQEKLRDESEKKKEPIISQIRAMEKELENQDVDGSLGARKAACESLINAVNAFTERKAN